MARKEYKLLIGKFVEHLVDELNAHGDEGWSIAMYNQEFGVTKVVLERELVTVERELIKEEDKKKEKKSDNAKI